MHKSSTVACFLALSSTCTLGDCPSAYAARTRETVRRVEFRYYPQRTATLLTAAVDGKAAQVRVGAPSLSWVKAASWDRDDSPPAVDPSGRFLYAVGANNFGVGGNQIGQFRIGKDGRLAPLHPPTFGGRPGPLTFHPNGRYAYQSQGQGFVLQYRIALGGQLVFAGDPGDIGPRGTGRYPSALRFDRSRRYAYATYRDYDKEHPNGVDRHQVYRIVRGGHPHEVRTLAGLDRFISVGDTVIWERKLQ